MCFFLIGEEYSIDKGLLMGDKGLLMGDPIYPYRDDREGCLFTATVQRSIEKSSGKSSGKILELLTATPDMTIPQLAKELGLSPRAVEKQVAKLQQDNQLQRIGPARGGHWQVNQ